MARLTFDQLVTQGGVLGDNDAVPTWVATKLKGWLRKQYASWAWPFLITQATGITVTAGTATKLVGNGNSGITEQISRIFSPVYWYGSSFAERGKVALRDFVGGPVVMQNELQDTTNNRGSPQSAQVRSLNTGGQLHAQLIIFPVPDKTYTLSFTYQRLPDDLSGSSIPEYPNELTLIQAAKCAAIEYDNSATEWYETELAKLAQMVAADRDAYGGNPSFGDNNSLDTDIFLP